jgi:hypothetical protein
MHAPLVLLLTTTIAAQGGVIGGGVQGLPSPPQPRDPRAALVGGKGVIRGRIIAADTGVPIRRATVMISGQGQRGAYTDAEGRYTFTGLPPGSYHVSASPGNHRPSYRTVSFGATSQNGPGKRVELADGQVLENVDIALPRGGVITGRVFDPYGDPAARVDVYPLLIRLGGEPAQTGPSATTDDLGQFRLFGLAPGSYIVRADFRMGMFSPGPYDVEGESIGFSTTYAPGTPSRSDAMRVRVVAGGEASVDIRLLESRMFKITGTVLTANGEPTSAVGVSLVHTEPGSSSSFGTSIGPNGTFTFRNVPPGSYEIVARLQPPRLMGPGQPPSGPPDILEMGMVRIDVSTTDVENVMVPMRRGESVSGQIVFDEAAPPEFKANVMMQIAERRMSMGMMSPVVVTGAAFQARGLFGSYLIRGGLTAGGGAWFLKAVLLNGKDITDVPVAFTSAHSGHLQLVFTSRSAGLEGTVTDEGGKPTREAQVLVFGADEESWVPFSSRTRNAGTPRQDDGKFTLRGLRDGRYYVVALPPGTVMIGGFQAPDRDLMESLKKVATEVVLNPGETRTVDLRVIRFEQ